MKENPPSDELHRRTAEREGHLCDEDEVDETDVLVRDAEIDNRLCEEGEDELQQRAY